MEIISERDRQYLKVLASDLAEAAAEPRQAQNAALWTAHNDLKTSQPVIFCDPENGWNEIITPDLLKCESELSREWEMRLRKRIFSARIMKDDTVADDIFPVEHVSSDNGWGVEIVHVGEEHNKAYIVKQAIEDYEEDFPKLHYPQITVNEKESADVLAQAHEIFDGILRVQQESSWWWSLGMTRWFIDLRGLEDFLCDLVLEPEWVHRMMNLLCEGTLAMLDSLEARGLLTQNIGNHYVGSGGFGFTDQIPKADGPVTTRNMWGFVESQETVSVSPEMYAEFILPYHKRITERFALNCCCCCEPYDARWPYLKQLPRLRRVSSSPWSDRRTIPVNLGKNYIASIKPNPSHLSLTHMNEDVVRAELRTALENSVGCVPELIMKDCHTLGNNPNNPVRWVEIAREEIDRISGL